MTAINSMKISIILLREITNGTELGGIIKDMIDTLDDYVNGRSNPYDYKVTEKAVAIINNMDTVIYDYAVEHYGKEYIDKWVTPDDGIYADADETYKYLMQDVCF